VHFGLGSATKIERLEIRWPSGSTEVLTNLGTDKFYSILEGSGVVPPKRIRPTPKNSISLANSSAATAIEKK
jgi:hypothetical protein